jgi:hypothetical protein
MTDSEVEALISEAAKGIPDEGRRTATAERLTRRLRTDNRSSRPDLPHGWRSEPNVMFEPGDPEPEPFDWGPRKWPTAPAYDKDLAAFLGDLACAADVPEAQTRGLAYRALRTPDAETSRVWPVLFAARVIGTDCPPAKGLPDEMRRQLEQLATQDEAGAVPPESTPFDPIE